MSDGIGRPLRRDTSGNFFLTEELADWLQNLAHLAHAKTPEDARAALHLSSYLRSRVAIVEAGILEL